METRGNTMDKDGLPDTSNKDDLEEGPDGDQKSKESVKGNGRAVEKFCSQRSEPG
jgi:hypothetical protein